MQVLTIQVGIQVCYITYIHIILYIYIIRYYIKVLLTKHLMHGSSTCTYSLSLSFIFGEMKSHHQDKNIF